VRGWTGPTGPWGATGATGPTGFGLSVSMGAAPDISPFFQPPRNEKT
jgi:hypothetical protein